MIDKSCDTKVIIGNDDLIGIEHLADFKSYLSFLKGTCQILDAHNGSTDAHIYSCIELARKCIGDGTCQLFQILGLNIVLYFLNKHDIALGNVENEILGLVGEQAAHHIVGGNVVAGGDADQQHHAGYIGCKVQLPRFGVDVAGQNVVQHHILNEVGAVKLFVVILLDALQISISRFLS